LGNDDLNWISGQDGGDNLALVLVERSHSATSHASPNPTSSQDNIPNYHPSPSYHNGNGYRLKGYENSLHETHMSVTTPFTWLWYRTIPWLRRAFLRYCYPEFNDPRVENMYAERLYESQKVGSFFTMSRCPHLRFPTVSGLCLFGLARHKLAHCRHSPRTDGPYTIR
jgi:hypothetical protein